MTEPLPRLGGRCALVTGASRGIGAAVARALSAAGARVLLVARGEDALRELARELGNNAVPIPADVAREAGVAAVADRVRDELGGPPDIIVNNAGIFRVAMMHEMAAELFADTVQTNLVAPFLVIRAFLPAMIVRGDGHFVTIGSIADRMTFPENGAYSAAKYGLRAMHEVLRSELRGTSVRATLISPGPVDTAIWDDLTLADGASRFPAREQMLPASAVADAVVWAACQPASVNIDELRLSRS